MNINDIINQLKLITIVRENGNEQVSSMFFLRLGDAILDFRKSVLLVSSVPTAV